MLIIVPQFLVYFYGNAYYYDLNLSQRKRRINLSHLIHHQLPRVFCLGMATGRGGFNHPHPGGEWVLAPPPPVEIITFKKRYF
jgi:hypothetical protein